MGAKILVLAFGVIAFSSCSVYKSGQTPDDVYYSPAPEVNEYVRVEKQEDRHRTYDEYSEDYRNDRFMRLSMNNSMRWNAFDDYYWNNNLLYNNYYGYNSWTNPWNSYYYWNSFYNPYCNGNFIIVNPKYPNYSSPISRPGAFRYNAYVNNSYNNNNLYFNNGGNNQHSRISSRYNNGYVTPNNGSRSGSALNRMFNNGNSSNNNNYDNNYRNNNSNNNSYTQPSSRSYTPSSGGSSSGSSGAGSGGGGGISRPSRGN